MATNYKLINTFGTKSILGNLPDSAWEFMSGEADDPAAEATVKALYASVPWLYRGTGIIAQSVAELPYCLYKGETEVTSSEDWKPPAQLAYLEDFPKLLVQLGYALTLEGAGYLFRDDAATIRATKRLIYWSPLTVRLDSARTEKERKIVLRRDVSGKTEYYTPEEVIIFWPADGYTEVGPPVSSPAKAAMKAAGAMKYTDEYVSAYFKRGAIRATMLAVKGNPSEAEKGKLTQWWDSITGGITKAFRVFTFNAEAVTPTIMGDGLEGLQNTELTQEKREEVATALGIPQSILFSTGARGLGGGGVSQEDTKRFYEMTVIPLARFILDTMNKQQLVNTGYRFVLNEDEMAIYQQDEGERAKSTKELVAAMADPEVFLLSANITGLSIDDDTRKGIEALIAERKAKPEPAPVAPAPTMETEAEDSAEDEAEDMAEEAQKAYIDDLNRWRRVALKKGAGVKFVSDKIPVDVYEIISRRLADCQGAEEIKRAFDLDAPEPPAPAPEPVKADDTPQLVAALETAIKALTSEPMPAPMSPITINLTANMPEPNQPTVTVNIPEQPAPVVNVTNEVQPAPVSVDVAAPNVTVNAQNDIVMQPVNYEGEVTKRDEAGKIKKWTNKAKG